MRGMERRRLRQQRPGPPPAAEHCPQEGPCDCTCCLHHCALSVDSSSDYKLLICTQGTQTGYTTATAKTSWAHQVLKIQNSMHCLSQCQPDHSTNSENFSLSPFMGFKMGWIDGSSVKSIGYSSRGPRFDFQFLHSSLQLSTTQGPMNLAPSH